MFNFFKKKPKPTGFKREDYNSYKLGANTVLYKDDFRVGEFINLYYDKVYEHCNYNRSTQLEGIHIKVDKDDWHRN